MGAGAKGGLAATPAIAGGEVGLPVAENGLLLATAPKLRFIDTTFYALVMMVGLRWLAVAAAVGPAALPLWALAFLTFFVPLSVATADLTAQFPGEGGLYTWVRETFGPLSGFLCGWFYWLGLLPYFAGILYFTSGLILSVAGLPAQGAALYLPLSLLLGVFVTALQFAGLRGSKWFTNFGAAGTWIIFLSLVLLAALFLVRGQSAANFHGASYLPPANFDTAILWGTVVFAFCGSETVAFLQDEVKGGRRTINFVLAALGVSLTLIYGVGTAAMLLLLPKAELTRLTGLPDALHAAFAHAGMPMLANAALGFLALAMLGGLTAWFGIGTRLAVAAGSDHRLPAVFARRHPKTGAPGPAIILMGAMTLFMVVLGQAGASAAAAYDFLVAMGVLAATVPYVFVFAAYLKRLGAQGGRLRLALGVVGLSATLVAIACTLVPSGSDPHPGANFLKIVIATLAATLAGLLFFWSGNRRRIAVGSVA
ncbi:MAG: APC family permease [Alphaproteobacteria bacterium]|nr:APC family permease [Alphaproteobacteria bacterium]